jgi:hypothetical protein
MLVTEQVKDALARVVALQEVLELTRWELVRSSA